MSDRCPEQITFSHCCKVRLAVLRETALSSAASLSPVEEIELVFGELLVLLILLNSLVGRVLEYSD